MDITEVLHNSESESIINMSFKVATVSMSLGRAWAHQLPEKLDQAVACGFQGIEIFYEDHEDLEYLAKSIGGVSDHIILKAVCQIRVMCDDRDLFILALQPFLNYEGLLDSQEHAQMIKKLKLWFQIAKILGTDIIQIPSSFRTKGVTGAEAVIVKDMVEVAELGLQETPPVRFVYENLSWGTYVRTWEHVWNIVAKVDRPNFGLALDTFHITGGEWGDLSSPDGKIKNADEVLKKSLQKMKKIIDVKKVFYVQVGDAERLKNPLTSEHPFYVDGQPPGMSWSRNARLFLFEKLGYLPFLDVVKAITEEDGLGYEGWISLELFSRTAADPGVNVPKEHARMAIEGWRKLIETMGW